MDEMVEVVALMPDVLDLLHAGVTANVRQSTKIRTITLRDNLIFMRRI
jgi:hypothetical protein